MTSTERALRKLSLQPGDILLVKYGSVDPMKLAHAGQSIYRTSGIKLQNPIVLVDDVSDLQAISEDQMRKHGWKRIPE